MKKACVFLLPSLLILNACSNDLDIAADYKETTIIYGLLNQADGNTHDIQVFRGFLDENTSALTVAKNPDSIYYDDNVEVTLSDGSQTFTLDRIIGPNRNEGIFVDSPNYVYRFTGTLNGNSVYTLAVHNPGTGHTVTAQTPLVKDFAIVRPAEIVKINLATEAPNEIQWRPAENGKIYQCVMRFYYEEWNLNTPNDIDIQYVDWLIFNNYIESEYVFEFDGSAFLPYLASKLEADMNIQRKALDAPLEFRFFVGANDLYEYIRVNGAQTGITSLQINPDYTNVVNGLGIFSSRYFKAKGGIQITQQSLDSLVCGSHTRELNFVNQVPCN